MEKYESSLVGGAALEQALRGLKGREDLLDVEKEVAARAMQDGTGTADDLKAQLEVAARAMQE